MSDTVEKVIVDTITDTVADISGYEEETASAVITALKNNGYRITEGEVSLENRMLDLADELEKRVGIHQWQDVAWKSTAKEIRELVGK